MKNESLSVEQRLVRDKFKPSNGLITSMKYITTLELEIVRLNGIIKGTPSGNSGNNTDNPVLKTLFGETVKAIRLLQGFGLREFVKNHKNSLAEISGDPYGWYTSVENGERIPRSEEEFEYLACCFPHYEDMKAYLCKVWRISLFYFTPEYAMPA
ncbi:MAG: hypothetical protein HPY53_01420 [Brevinematales bacterium]|nr:hypothetical protein [Brevinematales bacterium]